MFSRAYKRYALGAMTAVYTVNLVDRGLMILLLQPIKEDLRLSDTQLGFLTGIAFGLFYATVGLPIARWADRGNRVTITSLAIGLWGLTVMACVFVTNYLQLVVARIAAAIGESGCKPPTYSLIGDYFPGTAERTRALAVYLCGNSLSALASFIVGGWLYEMFGWRITFLVMGIAGLLLAVLVKLTVVEPRTHTARSLSLRQVPRTLEVCLLLWNRHSCRHLSIALILLYTLGLGLAPWYAAFMIRSHGMGTAELGAWLGVIFAVGGIAGVLSGGYIAARWFANSESSQLRLSAVSVAGLVPCFVAFLMLPHKYQALSALFPLMIVFNFCLGPTYSLLQRLVTDEIRATVMAIVMLLANLIGFGIGPQLVGILSDVLTPAFGTDGLRYAMLALSFVGVWAAIHFVLAGRSVAAELEVMARRAEAHVASTAACQIGAQAVATK
jgi:MFS family permease